MYGLAFLSGSGLLGLLILLLLGLRVHEEVRGLVEDRRLLLYHGVASVDHRLSWHSLLLHHDLLRLLDRLGVHGLLNHLHLRLLRLLDRLDDLLLRILLVVNRLLTGLLSDHLRLLELVYWLLLHLHIALGQVDGGPW